MWRLVRMIRYSRLNERRMQDEGSMKLKFVISTLIGCCTIAWASTVLAEPSPQAALLNQELTTKVPQSWQIHVTWRDEVLVAFITPPYQEALTFGTRPRNCTRRCSVCAPATAMPYGINLHLASQSPCSRQSEGNQPTLCAFSVRERVPDHRPLKIGIALGPLVRVKAHADADV